MQEGPGASNRRALLVEVRLRCAAVSDAMRGARRSSSGGPLLHAAVTAAGTAATRGVRVEAVLALRDRSGGIVVLLRTGAGSGATGARPRARCPALARHWSRCRLGRLGRPRARSRRRGWLGRRGGRFLRLARGCPRSGLRCLRRGSVHAAVLRACTAARCRGRRAVLADCSRRLRAGDAGECGDRADDGESPDESGEVRGHGHILVKVSRRPRSGMPSLHFPHSANWEINSVAPQSAKAASSSTSANVTLTTTRQAPAAIARGSHTRCTPRGACAACAPRRRCARRGSLPERSLRSAPPPIPATRRARS